MEPLFEFGRLKQESERERERERDGAGLLSTPEQLFDLFAQ